jgi:hypothetical protein
MPDQPRSTPDWEVLSVFWDALLGASASKSRGRPLGAKTLAIREAVLDLTDEYEVMTVRQVFYQLVSRGVVPKTENGGYRPVQTQVLKMRREGLLDWAFIADGIRWMRKPDSYESIEDALRATQRTYRRNLWQAQQVRPEVWLEKDALAGVVSDVTERWDVPLMVSRGTSSATFLHSAVMQAEAAWRKRSIATYVFALYDYDAAGGARLGASSAAYANSPTPRSSLSCSPLPSSRFATGTCRRAQRRRATRRRTSSAPTRLSLTRSRPERCSTS